jgi:peptidoglycan/LPS O-acetylase OafA/YrhL
MGFIRFILALSVLIEHSSPIFGVTILPGYVAVQSFYIISGFYMAMIYTKRYKESERPVFYFYTNRFLRLYPLYIIVVLFIALLSIVYGLFLGSYGEFEYYKEMYNRQPDSIWALAVVMISNITLVGQDIITFFKINDSGSLSFLGFGTDMQLQELLFVPIAWTVAVEIWFYLTVPFVAVKKLRIILALICIVLIIRLLLLLFFESGTAFSIYRFAPTEYFWFLLGIISFKLYEGKWLFAGINGWLLMLVWLALLFTYPFYRLDWIPFLIAFAATPVVFYRFSKSKVDRYFGELTYPMYISHIFVLMIVSANRFPKPFGPGLPLFILTVCASVFFYHFILKPIDRWRGKRLKSI